jgi:hypothetical protein
MRTGGFPSALPRGPARQCRGMSWRACDSLLRPGDQRQGRSLMIHICNFPCLESFTIDFNM